MAEGEVVVVKVSGHLPEGRAKKELLDAEAEGAYANRVRPIENGLLIAITPDAASELMLRDSSVQFSGESWDFYIKPPSIYFPFEL